MPPKSLHLAEIESTRTTQSPRVCSWPTVSGHRRRPVFIDPGRKGEEDKVDEGIEEQQRKKTTHVRRLPLRPQVATIGVLRMVSGVSCRHQCLSGRHKHTPRCPLSFNQQQAAAALRQGQWISSCQCSIVPLDQSPRSSRVYAQCGSHKASFEHLSCPISPKPTPSKLPLRNLIISGYLLAEVESAGTTLDIAHGT